MAGGPAERLINKVAVLSRTVSSVVQLPGLSVILEWDSYFAVSNPVPLTCLRTFLVDAHTLPRGIHLDQKSEPTHLVDMPHLGHLRRCALALAHSR
jgi:hypothetical protein